MRTCHDFVSGPPTQLGPRAPLPGDLAATVHCRGSVDLSSWHAVTDPKLLMQRSRLRRCAALLPCWACQIGRHPAGQPTYTKTLRGWHRIAQEPCYVPVVHGFATAKWGDARLRLSAGVTAAKGGASRAGGRGGGRHRRRPSLDGVWVGAAAAASRMGRRPRVLRAVPLLLPRSAVSQAHGLWVVGFLRAVGPRARLV